jgi:hypothetical protein
MFEANADILEVRKIFGEYPPWGGIHHYYDLDHNKLAWKG